MAQRGQAILLASLVVQMALFAAVGAPATGTLTMAAEGQVRRSATAGRACEMPCHVASAMDHILPKQTPLPLDGMALFHLCCRHQTKAMVPLQQQPMPAATVQQMLSNTST